MDEDLVGCQICNKAVAGINLKSHILQEHCNLLSDTECALCEQKFAAKHILKAHIKKVHLTEKSTCHICHKEYRDLHHHIKYTHDTTQICVLCGQAAAVRLHINVPFTK